MIDEPGPLRRPVPQQRVILRRTAIPIPLDRFPKLGNSLIDTLPGFTVALKVLAGGQQSFHKKRCLHQIAAIIEHAEHQHGLRSVAIQEVSPGAVIAWSFFQEIQDLREAFDALLSSDEPPIHSHDERHDAKSAGAGRDDALVSGNIFERRSRHRMRSFPVITKAGFLQHGEQLIVGQLSGGRGRCSGKSRLPVRSVDCLNPVSCGHSRTPNEVRVAIDVRTLNTDGLELVLSYRAIDCIALQITICNRIPADVDVTIVAFGPDILGRSRSSSSLRGQRA